MKLRADEQLKRAAPLLLEACKEALNFLSVQSGIKMHKEPIYKKPINKLESAIKKAGGAGENE